MDKSDFLPVGLAAGMIKTRNIPKTLIGYVKHITFGSFTLEPRQGNPEPTYWFDDKTGNSINAVGLKNQSLQVFLDEELPAICELLEGTGTDIRISIAPTKTGDAAQMSEMVSKSDCLKYISFMEVNAACPNHRTDGGRLHDVLAHDPKAVEILMQETVGFQQQRAIKIAPRMSLDVLSEYPDLAYVQGFEQIVSANTLLGSSVINGTQQLSVDRGGQAGAILRPGCIQQIRALATGCSRYGISLIACGGIDSAETVKANLKAGADTCQVATGYMQFGPKIFESIALEM